MTPTRTTSISSDFATEDSEPSWTSGGRFKYPVVAESNSWEACYKLAHCYDKEMGESWKDEIDKLLVFAGLFSAAVTAFVVEAFQMLQTDSTEQLVSILARMNNITLDTGTGTGTRTGSNTTINTEPESFIIRINIFWFLSLVLSLSTVVIGVLTIQWLREYQRNSDNSLPQNALGLRQMRYQGLLAWRVPEIVTILPLLLQSAVLLFFCGILDLLWSLNQTVAIIITIPIGLLTLFLTLTTILPAFQYTFTTQIYLRIPQCPFKSPQSWLFHRFFSSSYLLYFNILERLHIKSILNFKTRERRDLLRHLFLSKDWRSYDNKWRQQRDRMIQQLSNESGLYGQTVVQADISKSLSWIINTFPRDKTSIINIYNCFQDLSNDEKEVMLLDCDRFSPLSFDFRNKLGGVGGDGSGNDGNENPAISDYLSLRALDHLISSTGYGLDSTNDLLQHRVELYIRLFNSTIHIPNRPMIYCPLKYLSRYSTEIHIKLLHLSILLLSKSTRESDFAIAIVILNHTTLHPLIRYPPLPFIFQTETYEHVDRVSSHSAQQIETMDIDETLRQTFLNTMKEATQCFLNRPEIVKEQSVRVQIYRWFLRIVLSAPTSHTPLNLIIPMFKVIGPLVQLHAPPTISHSEYPINPVFATAWQLLLEGKYAELFQCAILTWPTKEAASVGESLRSERQ